MKRRQFLKLAACVPIAPMIAKAAPVAAETVACSSFALTHEEVCAAISDAVSTSFAEAFIAATLTGSALALRFDHAGSVRFLSGTEVLVDA